MYEIFFYLWIINILTFVAFGYDKHQAHYAKYRIPEAVLILLCVIGGAFGGLVGMWLFRHKTRKTLFRVTVPLLTLLTCLVFLFIPLLY